MRDERLSCLQGVPQTGLHDAQSMRYLQGEAGSRCSDSHQASVSLSTLLVLPVERKE